MARRFDAIRNGTGRHFWPFRVSTMTTGSQDSCRDLVFHIIWRAARDALMIESRTPQEYVREARHWLFSDAEHPYSANWWAGMAEMEHLLRKCREMVRYELLLRDRSGGVGSLDNTESEFEG
jgi:hypothetical protein